MDGSEWFQTEKARVHGADVLSCSDNPFGEASKRVQAENETYAVALATGSVALLPGVPRPCGYLVSGQMLGCSMEILVK